MILLFTVACLLVISGLLLLACFLYNSPISRTLARPGVSYAVGPVRHVVPDLAFGQEATYLVKPQVLKNMLDILQYTHHLLTRHRITYWITIGNLLGAVRHGGFTPWDDDMDMHVPLQEMDRLWALKPQIEADGYVLMKAAGGFKLAYNNRYRFPFIDLVFVEKDEDLFKLCFPLDRNGAPTFAKARQWPNECLPVKDVIPLQMIPFEHINVWCPAHPERLIKRIYGERALHEARHRRWPHLVNHFTMMTMYRLGLSKG